MNLITMLETHVTLSKIEWRDTLYTFLLALGLIGCLFLLQENINLTLSDEGFLWNGAVRTTQGDIPLRDFQAYDPGRYYWIAFWFLVLGQQGIMTLRFSVALFQLIGLTAGLLAARRVVKNWWLLGLIGLLLLAWMIPRYKVFESSLSMMAVYMAVRLIEKPSPGQHFVTGLFVGLVACMGRNHGLYDLLAFFLLILFLWVKLRQAPLLKLITPWLGGIALGYMPLL